MYRYLYGRFRHARSGRSFTHAQSVELDHLNGASRLGSEPGHELMQIEPAVDGSRIVVSKQLWRLLDRHVFQRPLRAPQIIHESVARDRIDPGRKELGPIIRMPSGVESDQSLLEKILRIGRALADPRELPLEIRPQVDAQLVQKGLVSRCTNNKDRRAVDIRINDLGLDILSKMDIEFKTKELLKNNLTEEEAVKLSDLLDKLRG